MRAPVKATQDIVLRGDEFQAMQSANQGLDFFLREIREMLVQLPLSR